VQQNKTRSKSHQRLLNPEFASLLSLQSRSGFETTRQKLKVRTRLLSNNPGRLTETHLPFVDASSDKSSRIPLKYAYQRMGVVIDSDRPEKFTYPFLKVPKNFESTGHFISSGQVAIHAVLQAFWQSGIRRIQVISDLYFESIEIVQDGKWKVGANAKLGIIDSSLLDIPLDRALKKAERCSYLIVDTTCWLHDSSKINRILRWSAKRGVCLILVRSSLKLDSMGMEYGRLGSALWLSPKKKPLPKEILARYEQNLRLWGGYAGIQQLYPFWMNRKFHTANKKWVESLEFSNRTFSKEIARRKIPPLFKTRAFEHGIFTWIVLPKLPAPELKKIKNGLMQYLLVRGFDAAQVASYPWDFISISIFTLKAQCSVNWRDSEVVRLSLPPLSRRQVIDIVDAIEDWMWNAQKQNADARV
jgi:hypothetical protein